MGIKVQQKQQTITPFGGISFVNDEFTRSGLSFLALSINKCIKIYTTIMNNNSLTLIHDAFIR
ncbi:MAG: hypothetical protein LBB90_05310 [Tannerella sp.]|jgi:hypothetical protein|nr:hypothetical protein [Tannerella sp.]